MNLNILSSESAASALQDLITELQALGMRLEDTTAGAPSRKGGAGPSDHKAVTLLGRTVMVPVHTNPSKTSPFIARAPARDGRSILERDGIRVGDITFPKQPRFYSLQTFDGIPYWKIAVLHSSDVLATTVLQNCIRYQNQKTTCQFCAIGQSLKSEKTIARKTPEQLAEVARAAVLLDNVKHMVLTTGTPNLTDRGARVLCESAFEIKGAVDLPIQAQCEPPDDFAWFKRMRDAGIDNLGMHLEAVEPAVRARIMPGKASVSINHYFAAFEKAVDIFGRGQVSTYILAGLGDSPQSILRMCQRLIAVGVYPFVVPFVPISGTPLESHPAPTAQFMRPLLAEIAALLDAGDLRSTEQKAGCGKCGACSSLASYERPKNIERKIELKPLHPVARREDFHDPIRWNDPISGRPAAPSLFDSDTSPRTQTVTTEIFKIKFAQSPAELDSYATLRHNVFCDEQKLFAHSDRDEHDTHAIPIIALAEGTDSVIGTVRIHQSEPGVWYGSRLAVAQGYRGMPGLSAALIRMAVSTAHGLGCTKFLANVQRQNVPLFRRLHWMTIGQVEVCGIAHHLMQADLTHYPPRAMA